MSRTGPGAGVLGTLSSRFFPAAGPHGQTMEFPDLGAHCSEPSCQRLGEGRSTREAGPDAWAWGLQVGREVGHWSWKGQEGGARGCGRRLGGVTKLMCTVEEVQCVANRAEFFLLE